MTGLNGYKTRPFDAILREVRELLRRSTKAEGCPSRRRPFRDDRQGRDRMHRRRARLSPISR
jgi:hypothetical protein